MERRGKDFGDAHCGTGGGLFGVKGLAEDVQEELTLIRLGRADRWVADRGVAGHHGRMRGGARGAAGCVQARDLRMVEWAWL